VAGDWPFEPLTGRFENRAKGYAVVVPRGYYTLVPTEPWPDNGCQIDLHGGIPTKQEWTSLRTRGPVMGAYAFYNAAFEDSLESIVASSLKELLMRGDDAVVLEARTTQLGPLTGRRIVVRYRDRDTQEDQIEEQVLAWYCEPSFGPIQTHDDWLLSHTIFVVFLNSPTNRYVQDRSLFKQFCASWRIVAVQ
jgi:hypothetical protein